MKHLLLILIAVLALSSCTLYEEETYPGTYMGGGKFVFYDYDIIVISSISEVEYIKTDTICLNAFNNIKYNNGGDMLLSQSFNSTPKDRRFVVGKTMWEFDGTQLYCDFQNSYGSISPTHEPYWVEYPMGLTNSPDKIKITNYDIGSSTTYTFETNNYGAAPPSKLTLLSPEIVTDLYTSSGARDKAITVRLLLKFMR